MVFYDSKVFLLTLIVYIIMVEKISWVSTVVGSFPYENTPENMEKAFWDQINAGVDYPCYPQLVDMISQFLDPAIEKGCGLRKEGLEYALDGDFIIPEDPVATEYGKFVVDFFKKYPEAKEKVKGWKACLTGPFTLAGKIIVSEEAVGGKKPIIFQEPRAIMSQEIIGKLAEFMAKIATEYNKMGATIISMDEPTLGLIVGRRKALYHENQFIIDTLNTAVAPIENYSSVHVCGRISPLLRDMLLESNVNILDHEFQKTNNEGIFTKEMFEGKKKLLAYGAIQSSADFIRDGKIEDYVESTQVISDRLLKAAEQYGKNNLILKPDCGFGGLMAQFGQEMASEIVRQKLKNLSESIEDIIS